MKLAIHFMGQLCHIFKNIDSLDRVEGNDISEFDVMV